MKRTLLQEAVEDFLFLRIGSIIAKGIYSIALTLAASASRFLWEGSMKVTTCGPSSSSSLPLVEASA
jgi:hypothetical protein